MISLRRYAVYFGLALFILLTLNHYRQLPGLGHGSSRSKREVRWDRVPVRNPVKSLKPVPTTAARRLPSVQHTFPEETDAHRRTRLERQAKVKAAFERCWQSYKQYAWGHDELAPLTGGVHDEFGGWAATLVDNLDNLWIMGFRDEFEEAVQAAVSLNLAKLRVPTINVFETTIRHLGGLLSAYDLSGDKRLLRKAKEFGEMLLVAFDTPNHMPITRWDPQQAVKGKQVADEATLVAEIGSLTMEFTRLSQLTGDPRWYDAVDRITRLFVDQQDKTNLPGMWPVTINAREADFTKDTLFTLSAMSDSLYEYFPKMYALLGGADSIYRKLYDGSMGTAIKHNLFRPMVPDDADILISGGVRALYGQKPVLEPQGQHLVCFAGGMFALGAKLFSQPAHMEIAKKLTNGCIWTYKHLPMNIMPEVFNMVPCESRTECHWNETVWKEAVKTKHANQQTADQIIEQRRLPPGFTHIRDRRYLLRPEAIESVFVLYRTTGETYLEEAGWEMFESIMSATQTKLGNAALSDITYSASQLKDAGSIHTDSMESFWMAETLKYFYLMFSDPKTVSLDEWVFNTEAHPFRRRLPAV